MNKDFEDEKPLILINPEIKEVHGEVLMSEGCLSIPDVHSDVLRPEKIFVEYYDLNMKGICARI
jgi:peptide deformylase (EC 3.5.1.88)